MSPVPTYRIMCGDALSLLPTLEPNSVHATVTDPPFGLVEFSPDELAKRRTGRGGIWRLPRTYDGYRRQPSPRFTVLTDQQRIDIGSFFDNVAHSLSGVLVPGGHAFVASNSLVSYLVDAAFVGSGFEKRGHIVRVVQTLRGGDRPKNAHREFPEISVSPRAVWEPWLLFRKPCEGRVQDNLRKWKAGGLRRPEIDIPFKDLIWSSPASKHERNLAPHPSLKPQAFIRQLVRASLPMGEGVVLDPFMGAGSTIAAAFNLGFDSIGIEIDEECFRVAENAIPTLAALEIDIRKA